MFVALRALAVVAVAILGLWLTYHVWLAMRTGTANVHNDRVRRQTRPRYYWTAVIVQAVLAVACFIGVAQGFLR
jgi:hypothetical protein